MKSPLARWLYRDAYTVVTWLLFGILIVYGWRGYVREHEAIYLLGSRRIADPDFLAGDIVWESLPPTTFLFDHLLAPLWVFLDDFGIVVVGRLVAWFCFSWSLAVLGRAMRLPPWSVVAGCVFWLLWEQTLTICGDPLEGFQPKLTAYPLIFFSLAFAIRGQAVFAGLAAGLGTVFHIVVGGWACLALFLSMVANRALFSVRQLGFFLLATAPLIGPLVLVVGYFHSGGLGAGEQAVMDEIYVRFAQPHCCDPDFFLTDEKTTRAAAIFPVAALLLLLWPERRAGRIVAGFVVGLVAFFLLGLLAWQLELLWVLKVYPFQVGSGLPPLFLALMAFALTGRVRQLPRLAWPGLGVGLAVLVWMAIERDVVTERLFHVPSRFVDSLERVEFGRYDDETVTPAKADVYAWIRDNTPPRSVFLTPYLPAFWTYAERDQVASFRHPPHDRTLIEWKERLEAQNGFRPFSRRGFKITSELNRNQRRLGAEQLVRIRDAYGATHYLTIGRRSDLEAHRLYANRTYAVYDLTTLEP